MFPFMLSENTTHAILHRGMACVVSQESIFLLIYSLLSVLYYDVLGVGTYALSLQVIAGVV